MNDKELTVWIPVWGDKHLGLLRDYTLPSLMTPGNLPGCGLDKIHVIVCGLDHERQQAAEIVSAGLAGLPVEVDACNSAEVRDPMHGLRYAMHACVCRGTRLLIAMPDTIYGGGSVSNLMNYARGKPVTIAAAHIRINEQKYFSRFPKEHRWLDNRSLVKACFELGGADVCNVHQDNVNWLGGVAWTKINDDTRLMLHYLPTPYLCWITPSDEAHWQTLNTFGHWDHTWPALLIQEQRFRVVGSSDVFFLVELETPERGAGIKVIPGSVGNELYHHRRPNNDVCGCFLIEMRG